MELVAVADFPDSVVWMQILDSSPSNVGPESEFVRAVAVVVSLRHGPMVGSARRRCPPMLLVCSTPRRGRHSAICSGRCVEHSRRDTIGQVTRADEAARVAALIDAENRAEELFGEVVARGLITPGITERELSTAIRDLAADAFGVTRYWHKADRAGRDQHPAPVSRESAGPRHRRRRHRLSRFRSAPGRLGGRLRPHLRARRRPDKLAVRDALEPVWLAGRAVFDADPDITGEELYDAVVAIAEDAGFLFGGDIAGHLVGDFPHESIPGDKIASYIAPGSTTRLRDRLPDGTYALDLEIHLLDPDRRFGGFHEQLLDIRRH